MTNHVVKHIALEGESLVLSNFRALYWPRLETLVLSDLHIGKSAHFRKNGIPISSKVQDNDLNRLSFLIEHFNANQLLVVGDFFHAGQNADFDRFQKWRTTHKALKIVLIKGNHDRLSQQVYDNFEIELEPEHVEIPPFKFIHEPNSSGGLFNICGHIHPGYMLKLKGRPKIKLPCFQLSDRQLILPAFSEFTGLAISEFQKENRYYAFSKSAFYEFN